MQSKEMNVPNDPAKLQSNLRNNVATAVERADNALNPSTPANRTLVHDNPLGPMGVRAEYSKPARFNIRITLPPGQKATPALREAAEQELTRMRETLQYLPPNLPIEVNLHEKAPGP